MKLSRRGFLGAALAVSVSRSVAVRAYARESAYSTLQHVILVERMHGDRFPVGTVLSRVGDYLPEGWVPAMGQRLDREI